jgi:hypothetical protein
MGCIALVRCVLVLRCGSAGVVWYPYAGWSTSASTNVEMTQQISRKFLRMDVLTFEICWALNNEIIKQVTSSWSVFIQLVWILFAELSERNFLDVLDIFTELFEHIFLARAEIRFFLDPLAELILKS